MAVEEIIPRELEPAVNDAVAFAAGETAQDPDLTALNDWVETERRAELLDEGQGFLFAVRLDCLDLSDEGLRSAEDLGSGTPITGDMRIGYARERMEETLSEDLVPSVQTYEVTRGDGASALLGCTSIFAGQDEDIEWHGAYVSRDAFLSHLKAKGYFVVKDVEQLTDEELAGMWEANLKAA